MIEALFIFEPDEEFLELRINKSISIQIDNRKEKVGELKNFEKQLNVHMLKIIIRSMHKIIVCFLKEDAIKQSIGLTLYKKIFYKYTYI